MVEESQKKVCDQCGLEKLLIAQFYRTKNGKDGYMKMCKDCYNVNKQQNAQRSQREIGHRQQEREVRKQQARKMEAQRVHLSEVAQHTEEYHQKQRIFLDTWFAEQPSRKCIACGETKAAVEFGYSELAPQINDYWLPSQLHRRCKPCHEKYREKNLIPCVICQQGIRQPMNYFAGYSLFGNGTRISLCCRACESAFQVLPADHQRFYIRARVNLLFPTPQAVYSEIDPLSQQTRYIGRSGHVKRRHSEHKRNIHQEQPLHTYYDKEMGQYVEVAWTSRANWMFDLKQQGLEAKQHILVDVQPAAYAIEYERRAILHAIQQKWPILNAEALSGERVLTSSLDFLRAPFGDLVSAGWFSNDGIAAFIRAWYTQ